MATVNEPIYSICFGVGDDSGKRVDRLKFTRVARLRNVDRKGAGGCMSVLAPCAFLEPIRIDEQLGGPFVNFVPRDNESRLARRRGFGSIVPAKIHLHPVVVQMINMLFRLNLTTISCLVANRHPAIFD